MAETPPDTVCVVIAAKNAAATIATALRSALSQPRVSEIVVVDDGSTDRTAEVARREDDGSGRLTVVSFPVNRGPAAARNHAVAVSTAPLIAILDADDFFFPGRFEAMFSHEGWDFIADNIAFTNQAGTIHNPQVFEPRARAISACEFIEGNISRSGKKRGEIGFLKPVMRRSFLDRHRLRYDETLRLGEDYDLYLRALVCGARYMVIEQCGYGAVVRSDSLSGRHRTADLLNLYEAGRAVAAMPGLAADVREALARHQKQVLARYELRAFLDRKKQGGVGAAARYALRRPAAVPAIAGGIIRDKMQRFRPSAPEPAPQDGLRYLLPGVPVAQK